MRVGKTSVNQPELLSLDVHHPNELTNVVYSDLVTKVNPLDG